MRTRPHKSVVVTGTGCITPIGNDVRSFWAALLAGKNGAAPITSFETSPYRTRVGCEVKGFVAQGPGLRGRASSLAVVAAREALQHAGLDPGKLGPRLGISIGTTMGEGNFLDRLTTRERAPDGAVRGAEDEPPWGEVQTHSAWSITHDVAQALGIEGPQASLPAACSAGNYAVGLALDWIRQGHADLVVAGGAEAFSESAFAGFNRLKALSADVCRPFDRDRQGLLLGEGAGLLILEDAEHARRRGAEPLAIVRGYGLSCDAHHITGPHPEGEGAAACMRSALEDSGASADDVDYVCCHGTGTIQNDRIEAKALQRIFLERSPRLPVSSIKAVTGHMMGAASAVEGIACVLALRHGILPPTWNHRELDVECPLDVIPNRPRELPVRLLLNNSYAFGGNNACVAFGAV